MMGEQSLEMQLLAAPFRDAMRENLERIWRMPNSLADLDLDLRIRGAEAAYDAADLRQFARVALTVDPEPSSYEIKHGAIPAGDITKPQREWTQEDELELLRIVRDAEKVIGCRVDPEVVRRLAH